jgi:hypothetical protein
LIELLSRTDRAITAVELRNASLDDVYRALAVENAS